MPSVLHAEVICFAAEHRCHVFAEKPLALNVEQGQQIVATVRRMGVVCMPCFQYRDRWIHERYRNAFREGALGHPVVLQQSGVGPVRPKTAMHRRSVNGGPLIDMACHYIDLLRWITGAEPRRVFAAGHVFGADKKHLDGIDDLAVDEACVEVTYTDGHQLQLYLSWGMPEGFPSYSEGFLVGPSGLMRPVSGGLEQRTGGEVKAVKQPEVQSDPGIAVRTERFIRAIERDEPPDITCEDAMIALNVSHAALQSIESGEAVEV